MRVIVAQNASWKQLVGKVGELQKSSAALANPHKSSALRHRPTECPGPFILTGGLVFPAHGRAADDQQLKTKHRNRYWPSRLHHTPFLKVCKGSKFISYLWMGLLWVFFTMMTGGGAAILAVPGLCCASPWSSRVSVSFWPVVCAPQLIHFQFLLLPELIYSLDIGFTLLLFSYWFNELLMVYFIVPMIHGGTDLFQSGEWIIAVKTRDHGCMRPIFFHHILMKLIQASLLLRGVLKDWFCIIQLKRANFCWKVLFSLKTLIDIWLGRGEKFLKKKVIQKQSNQQTPAKKVTYQREYT